jgi:hypothetical protein
MLHDLCQDPLNPSMLVHLGEALLFQHEHPQQNPLELGGPENGLKWMRFVGGMELSLGAPDALDCEVRQFLNDMFMDANPDEVVRRACVRMERDIFYFKHLYKKSLLYLLLFLRNLCGVLRYLEWPGGQI